MKIAGLAVLLAGCMVGDDPFATQDVKPRGDRNPNGFADSVSSRGTIDTSGPFFASLGTNGRSCASCHIQAEGWAISADGVQARFDATDGLDPIFRTNDGSNRPDADISSVGTRFAAFSMLRTRGLIRVGMPIPANAEFTLIAVDDPYGYAKASDLSLFRRPLPSTNLRFLSTLMWDARESQIDIPGDLHSFNLLGGLSQQAIDATLGHAQATGTSGGDMAGIVDFEMSLSTAQVTDNTAGALDDEANGGPNVIPTIPFFLGINDPLGENRTGQAFTPVVFTLFDGFAPPAKPKKDPHREKQYSIFRGQQLFNTRTFTIGGVKGLNDVFFGGQAITGTCTTCHDTPNVGNHSISIGLDLGLTDESRRTSDMPLYTLQNNATGEIIKTTDPGRAMITGKWADIAKFKGAILRGLSSRAPYFHNGIAATLADAVEFYNQRFAMGLSAQEKSDLTAFLSAL